MSHRSKLIRRRRYHRNWLTPERLQRLVAPIVAREIECRYGYFHLPFYGTPEQWETYLNKMKELDA